MKAVWDEAHKNFWDEIHMPKALITRSMAHLDSNIVQSFQNELQQDPNKSFGDVFQRFLERYGISNETEQHKNRTQMEANWNYNNGGKALIN